MGSDAASVSVVDSQIHLYGANTPERPWRRGVERLHGRRDFSRDEAIAAMDAAGVSAAVLVPPSTEGDRNDLCVAASHSHPRRFTTVGRLPLGCAHAPELLRSLIHAPGLSGLRLTFNRPPERAWLDDDRLDWFWTVAEEQQLPLYLHVPGMLGSLRRVLRDFPGLKVAVDHLGIGSETPPDQIPRIIDDLIDLSAFQNVCVKASAVPCISREAYPFADTHEFLRRLLEAYGPHRVFWGSDLTRLQCSYSQSISMFTQELPFLVGEDLRLVMGAALCTWLGWQPPAAPSTTGGD